MIPINIKQSRKPIKTPATSEWYKGKRLQRLEAEYKKTALVIQLIISTGIRTSELPMVTVESIKKGYIELEFIKNTRTIILHDEIRTQILSYANERGIASGAVFLTVKGIPCNKTSMFHSFGKLAAAAGIEPELLTSDALRKYYNDKCMEKKNISTVQSSLGFKNVNYYVEYDRQDDEILLSNLDDLFDV